jgi:hypothetical protein
MFPNLAGPVFPVAHSFAGKGKDPLNEQLYLETFSGSCRITGHGPYQELIIHEELI